MSSWPVPRFYCRFCMVETGLVVTGIKFFVMVKTKAVTNRCSCDRNGQDLVFSIVLRSNLMRACWNGRQAGLKIRWGYPRGGSSPPARTKSFSLCEKLRSIRSFHQVQRQLFRRNNESFLHARFPLRGVALFRSRQFRFAQRLHGGGQVWPAPAWALGRVPWVMGIGLLT